MGKINIITLRFTELYICCLNSQTMNIFTKKFKELVYSIKTDDHYSEYDEAEDDLANKFKLKEFNLTKKYNNNKDSVGIAVNDKGSSLGNLNTPTIANATGNDELNLSDDEPSYHHNPNSLYANHDLEYSSDNVHLSHLGDHRYRNSSNDIDEDEEENHEELYNEMHNPNRKTAPYEDAIDDGSKEVIAAWEYIKNWCYENSNDLYASLNDPCSTKDLKDVEIDLELILPKSFKVSLRIHDGQELDGLSGVQGLLYGLSLMTLYQIVSMRDHWSKIYYNLYTLQRNLDKLPKQGSIPPNYVKLQYCNPRWIPVITDNAGNHIAIDMDPDVKGTPGQVIIFGRDFDTKFVVANNWGQFLSSFVQDLKNGNWDLDEDEDNDFLKGDGELLFIDSINHSRVYEDYLNVLKRRVWSTWKKQRDLEILAKNKPRFNPAQNRQTSQQSPDFANNSSKVNKEVERRVGSVRDFSSHNDAVAGNETLEVETPIAAAKEIQSAQDIKEPAQSEEVDGLIKNQKIDVPIFDEKSKVVSDSDNLASQLEETSLLDQTIEPEELEQKKIDQVDQDSKDSDSTPEENKTAKSLEESTKEDDALVEIAEKDEADENEIEEVKSPAEKTLEVNTQNPEAIEEASSKIEEHGALEDIPL